MKKIVCMLCFIFMFANNTSISFAYNPNRPEWKDICPYGYENANEYNTTKSVVGTDKHWKIKEYNYWVDRKQRFENDLKECDKLEIEYQNVCYSKLLTREEKINSTTITPLQEWEQKKANMQQKGQNYLMYDAMKNKNYNINGNIRLNHW